MPVNNIDKLAMDLIAAKKALAICKERVAAIEAEIDKLIGFPEKIEGTIRKQGARYEAKAVRKINRKLDPKGYLRVKSGIPEGSDPIKERDIHDPGRYKVSLKDLRPLEKYNPEFVAEFITTSPAKTSVEVKEMDNSDT